MVELLAIWVVVLRVILLEKEGRAVTMIYEAGENAAIGRKAMSDE